MLVFGHMALEFPELKKRINETHEWLRRELSTVRTGRATPALLDAIRVEAYGVLTPLGQLASVGLEDAKTLSVTPWDREHLKAVEKAITDADLGVSVAAGDTNVRVIFPELTQERRDMLVKVIGDKFEEAKKSIRSARNEEMDDIEKMKKDGEIGEDEAYRNKEAVQKQIDGAIEELEALVEKKKGEIQS